MEMKNVIRDLVIYFIYVAIVYIISYGNRDPNAFLSKQAVESAVIFGGLNCDILPTDDPRYKKCNSDQVLKTNNNTMTKIYLRFFFGFQTHNFLRSTRLTSPIETLTRSAT